MVVVELQGVFSSVLPMTSFINQIGDDAVDSTKKGWLVSILELGAWAGTLFTGYLADKLSRKFTILLAVVVFVRHATHGILSYGSES